MAGWPQIDLKISDYAAFGAKLRELAVRPNSTFRLTVAEFRAHFGNCASIGDDNLDLTATVTFQRPEFDAGSVLTVYLPHVSDIDDMAAADAENGPYELPDFYHEIFVKPVYANLPKGEARERIRNSRLAEYTTNKCH